MNPVRDVALDEEIKDLSNICKYTQGEKCLNPLTTNVPHHIETSQLICIANQITGFYMVGNIGR